MKNDILNLPRWLKQLVAMLVDGERPMMGFETITLAPFDRRLIDVAMLSSPELEWLNAYHARVNAELAPRVDTLSAIWLEKATAPV